MEGRKFRGRRPPLQLQDLLWSEASDGAAGRQVEALEHAEEPGEAKTSRDVDEGITIGRRQATPRAEDDESALSRPVVGHGMHVWWTNLWTRGLRWNEFLHVPSLGPVKATSHDLELPVQMEAESGISVEARTVAHGSSLPGPLEGPSGGASW